MLHSVTLNYHDGHDSKKENGRYKKKIGDIFGDEYGDKFSDKFDDKKGDKKVIKFVKLIFKSPNSSPNLSPKSSPNLVTHQILCTFHHAIAKAAGQILPSLFKKVPGRTLGVW